MERDTEQTKVPASPEPSSLQPTAAPGPSAQKGTRKGRQRKGPPWHMARVLTGLGRHCTTLHHGHWGHMCLLPSRLIFPHPGT